MAKLFAQFNIDPTFPLIVECKEDEELFIEFKDNEYDIRIQLPVMEYGLKSGRVNSDLYKQLVNKIVITVTKEVDDIPEIPLTEEGGKDYSQVAPYFNNLKVRYAELARRYYQRLIRYVKYEMRQPFQNEKQINEDHFSNPLWYDDKGNNFGSGGHYYFLVEPMPGVNGKLLGVKTLKSENCTELLNYLQYDVEIELYEEIMSDAQSAIFSRNIRRAIFEMAIVCELFTKRKYFSKGGISGLAFDYFEDKGKLKVTVMELISTVAYEVLGESYKDYSPDDYRNVDYLFRCRNKVAHRGEVVFKDDSATLITPDLNLVECWYDSVGNLLNWLDSK